MKIRYLSDLHLEFIKSNKIQKYIQNIKPNIEEICVLSGDIGNPYKEHYDIFIKFINNSFKHTFIITGNHEYYNENTIEETNDYLKEYFKQFENITFLNNSYKIYENYCFIGTTLWCKIKNPLYEINDVHKIKNFDYLKCNQLNMLAIDFLEDTLKNILIDNSETYKIIIITHHVPSFELIHSKYLTEQMRPYNQWFYCDMSKFIEEYAENITCWFYGHTHTESYNTINNIPFYCNPIGYPNENRKINFNKTISV